MSGAPATVNRLPLLIQHLGGDSEDARQDLQALFTSVEAFSKGNALLPVLEMLRAGHQAASFVHPEGPSSEWAAFLRQRLAHSKNLPEGLRNARSLTPAPAAWDHYNKVVELAKLHAARAMSPRMLAIVGVLAAPGLHPMDGSAPQPMDAGTLARVVSMARACGGRRTDQAVPHWKELEELLPFTADALRDFASHASNDQVRRLASALAVALESPECGLPPRSCFVGPPRPPKAPAAAPRFTAKPKAAPNKTPKLVRPPSAASLVSLAHHARAAMTTSVSEAWGTVPVDRLITCTAGLMQALDSADSVQVDFAISLLVSFFISHHLESALKLSLRDNDDFYYEPTSGCIWLSRKALLKLSSKADEAYGAAGGEGWFYFLLPQKLVDVLTERLQNRPNATELADLLSTPVNKAWIQAAQRFLMSFGDGAYPLYLGRWARSYGPAVATAGAGDSLAGHLSGWLVLAPDSGSHYYGVPADTVRAHIRRAFVLLKLGEPVATPQGAVFGRRLWSDDDLRREYAAASLAVRQALSKMPGAADLHLAAQTFNAGMVGLWQGYPVTTPSRPQLPGRVSVDSALSHADWHYRWDEDGPHRSDRLLPIGRALRSVFCAAVALREAFIARLRELGTEEADLPALLVAPRGTSPLFLQAFPHPRRLGRWAVAALGSKEHGGPPSGYKAGTTDGRAFWLSEGLTSLVHGAERLLGGHGRRAALPGHAAQTIPVLTQLEEVRGVVQALERRLRLPSFADQPDASVPLRPFSLDLSFIARRRPVGSRPGDLPQHYCDSYTLPALQCIEACEEALGQGPGMDGLARVLLALIVAQGVVDSDDVEFAWAALAAMFAGPLARELVWNRASGQEISFPLLHPLWVALVLLQRAGVTALAPLHAAEASLLGWLIEEFPAATWPAKTGAVVAAMGFLAARVQRLVVPPFAVQASRPSVTAAVFDRVSHDRLYGRTPALIIGAPVPSGYRRQRPMHKNGGIAELRRTLGRLAGRRRPLGGDERRALRIGRVLRLKFGPGQFNDCEWLGWVWLTLEAQRWAPLHAKRDAPSTWYQYLCYLADRLRLAPKAWNPEEFDGAGWRAFGVFMLDVSAIPTPERRAKILEGRKKALTRLVLLLSELPEYSHARHALEGQTTQPSAPKYRPSAASAMVLPRDIEACVKQVRQAPRGGRFETEKRALLLMLPMDLCGRTAEPLCLRPKDFTADGSMAVVRESTLSHLKGKQGRRYNRLAVSTQEAARSVLASLRLMPLVQRFVFIQQGAKVDLGFGERLQNELWPQLVAQTGNIRVRWYSLRGAGLMQALAPRWDVHGMAWLQGPFLAWHARRLLDALAERGPGQFQWGIGRTGHLSDRTPIPTYLPFWTYIYAASLCLRMQRVKVSSALADALSQNGSGGLRQWNLRSRRDYHMPRDEWAWTVLPSVPNWTMKAEHLSVQAPKAPKAPRQPQGPRVDSPLYRLTALRHVLLRVLGHDPELDQVHVPAHHQSTCDELYHSAPRFEEVHTSRKRKSGVDVPQSSALKRAQSPEGLNLLRKLAHAEARCVQALQRVLDVSRAGTAERVRLALTPERLTLALRALPNSFGIEVALASGDLTTAQIASIKGIARVHVPDKLKRDRNPTTTRVVPWPHARPKDFHQPAMWGALIRLAVHILGLIGPQERKSP